MRKLIPIFVPFVHGQSFAIPLGYRENGMPYINGTVPSLLGNSPVSFNLRTGPENRLWLASSNHDDLDRHESFLEINITPEAYPNITILNPRVSLVTPVDEAALSVDMIKQADIGISRSSYLVETFSPIDIIHNRDIVVFRSTDLGDFMQNCVPGTHLTLPFIPRSSGIVGDLRLGIDFGDGMLNHYIGVVGNRESESILEINRRDFLEILGYIVLNLTPNHRILQCAQVRHRLPTITIRMLDVGFLNSLGHVVLYPEDYTILAPDGSCALLVRESPGRPDIAYINPLMIPNVNVRFTSDNMILCDSRDVQ